MLMSRLSLSWSMSSSSSVDPPFALVHEARGVEGMFLVRLG